MTANGAELHPFYCEIEDCDVHGERVEGSPVYHFLCLRHAEQLGLHVIDGYVPSPAPQRTMPVAVFDGFSEALGREVRVAPLEQLIIALEAALVADEPLGQVRQLLSAMRTGAYSEPQDIPSVIAPGF